MFSDAVERVFEQNQPETKEQRVWKPADKHTPSTLIGSPCAPLLPHTVSKLLFLPVSLKLTNDTVPLADKTASALLCRINTHQEL